MYGAAPETSPFQPHAPENMRKGDNMPVNMPSEGARGIVQGVPGVCVCCRSLLRRSSCGVSLLCFGAHSPSSFSIACSVDEQPSAARQPLPRAGKAAGQGCPCAGLGTLQAGRRFGGVARGIRVRLLAAHAMGLGSRAGQVTLSLCSCAVLVPFPHVSTPHHIIMAHHGICAWR